MNLLAHLFLVLCSKMNQQNRPADSLMMQSIFRRNNDYSIVIVLFIYGIESTEPSQRCQALILMEGYIDYNWQHGVEVEQDRLDRLASIGNEFAMMN
ncbi:hypothetical protein [Pseudalkalibacillus hwajinpoensis]|uniref:hypothetical protein n=1 Tax=Guptibacillus hwajinpoensis TaxID=208199 RepID=UPI00384E7698